MSKNHARKNAARARRAAHPEENHRQAVEAVRHHQHDDETVFVVDYPAPELDGRRPCPDCDGSGMSGDGYEQRFEDGPAYLVGTVCRSCLGCGRAEHDGCRAGAHANDTDQDDDAYDDWRDDGEDEEAPERCFSCGGRKFWHSHALGLGDTEADAAQAELDRRIAAAGVDPFQVTGAAAFGELDHLLGDGAQDLAVRADTSVWVKLPCGCNEGAVRPVRRSELEVGV